MFFKRDVVLAQEYLGFLLLNLFDLFLTGYIFKHHGHEANGAAALVMKSRFGMGGFAVYKFFLVLIVIMACEGVSLQSVRTSKIIITVGCIIYLAVVFWECFLILTAIHGVHFKGLLPVFVLLHRLPGL